MELSQKYVYEVYKQKSFSNAAQALFISQPSLSAMVKKLERELGFQIFNRTKKALTLTPQGEIYIYYLEECLMIEMKMKDRIGSLDKAPKRKLLVGGGSFLSTVLYPMALTEISQTHPDIAVDIDMGANGVVHNIKDKITSGILDVAISYALNPASFFDIPIFEELYYFTVRRDFPGAERLIPYSVTLEEILCDSVNVRISEDYCIPKDIPILRRKSIPTMDLNSYISETRVANFNISNIRSGEMFYDLMLRGLGADISSDLIIAANSRKSKDVLFLPLHPSQGHRVASIIYNKNRKLSDSALEFISIVKSLCEDKKSFFASIADFH